MKTKLLLFFLFSSLLPFFTTSKIYSFPGKTKNESFQTFGKSFSNVDYLFDVQVFDPNTVMAFGSNGQTLKTNDGGFTWINNSFNQNYDLYDVQFLNNSIGWLKTIYVGTFLKTTDGGNNWINFNQTIGPYYFIDENNGWTAYSISGTETRILKTTNGGLNWNIQFSLIDSNYTDKVYFTDQNTGWTMSKPLCCETKIMKTTDGGNNWFEQSYLNSYLRTICFVNNNTVYAAGYNGEILKTTNGGNNWIYLNSGTNIYFTEIVFLNENTGWVSGQGSILKTSNGGINWVSQLFSGINISSIKCFDSNNVWAVGSSLDTSGGVIFKTINGGDNWVQVFSNSVSVSNITVEIPQNHFLYQNYPNPFNPNTIINYEIPGSEFVKLEVFDITGKEVVLLVNEKQNAGKYSAEFKSEGLPSGIYIYKLISGNFTQTKRMILVK